MAATLRTQIRLVARKLKRMGADIRAKGTAMAAGRGSASMFASMTAQRQRIGRAAEDLVARRLTAGHWAIVERNARTRYGELDIVARDGLTLVFVEVKAGREGSAYGPERPVLAVDRRKQLRIRRLAVAWMAEHREVPYFAEIRFDAVGVTFDRNGRPVDLEHLKGAF
jgi:putative endonuclease